MNKLKNIWVVFICLVGAISSVGMEVEFKANFISEEEDSNSDVEGALLYTNDIFQIDLSKNVDFSKINMINDDENRAGELIHDPATSAMSDMEYRELAFEDFKKSIYFSSTDKAAKECIAQCLNESRAKAYGKKSSIRIPGNSLYKLAELYLKMGHKERGDFCIEQAAELGNDNAIKKLEILIALRKYERQNTLNNKRPAEEKPLSEELTRKKRKMIHSQ